MPLVIRTSIPMTTTTRKHAAIMFTDIVGYTALMGSNEDRAFETLRKNREIHSKFIEQFNGNLIKEMGDGMLISFDLASDAVRCAIEIQKACQDQDIALKIGIHEGEMVFEGADVLGDAVNIASRLESDTFEGCIYISGSVYRDIKNRSDIQTKYIKEKRFKNVDEPIKVYEVLCDKIVNQRISSKNYYNKVPIRKYLILLIGFLAIAILSVLIWQKNSFQISNHSASKKDIIIKKGIAVLPFRSIGDEESSFLADGIMEAIISDLSNIHQLKVTSRNSMELYRETLKNSKQIAIELNVDFLLEGSAQKYGNQYRITVKLIDPLEDDNVWAGSYDGEMRSLFDTQTEIARSVAHAMEIRLTEEETDRISIPSTTNIEANEFYVKGRYFWNKRTEEDLFHSLNLFKEAIALDSNFALAWAGVADAYIMLCGYGHMPYQEGHAHAEIAANKALQINSKLAEAYTSLGWVYAFNDYDWTKSQQSFDLALQYKASYSVAHSWNAWMLAATCNPNLAEQHSQISRTLDPLSDIINASSGWVKYTSGKYEEAKEHFKAAISLNPNFPRFYFWIGHTFMAEEEYDSAIFYLKKALTLENESPQYISCLGFCYGRAQQKS